jgi:beta-barrel assembly-enhancing protease
MTQGPRLENRLPPENLHGADEHPLREMAWLLGASALVLAAVVVLVGWGAQWLAPRVPFATEVALAERWVDPAPPDGEPAEDRRRRRALQALADRVAATMRLPPGMAVVLRDERAPAVNAFATVGGRIVVLHGLLARLESEQALAALLAHEIAHVKHRHVAANLGRGMALSMLLGLVSADAGAAAAEWALGQAAGLALLGYSRDQETQADDEALQSQVAMYGHAGGLVQLFEVMDRSAPGASGPEMLRSHPFTAARLQTLRDRAIARGWATTGALQALPVDLQVPRPAD